LKCDLIIWVQSLALLGEYCVFNLLYSDLISFTQPYDVVQITIIQFFKQKYRLVTGCSLEIHRFDIPQKINENNMTVFQASKKFQFRSLLKFLI
jgi:hypothetical protein